MMERIELRLEPRPIICYDFIDGEGNKRNVSAVLVPFKIERREDGTRIVGWACNYGEVCRNPGCRYSKTYREKKVVGNG